MALDITNTFFFDDTDTNPSNPNSSNPNFKGVFNNLDPSRPNSPTTPAAAGESEDGWLNSACSNSSSYTSAALFDPGPSRGLSFFYRKIDPWTL